MHVLKKLRELLRTSPHIHQRERPPEVLHDLVGLLDRFLDDKLKYELEWDDFISWRNPNPNIEAIRERIADMEGLFFSKDLTERKRAVEALLDERNRAAALAGIPPRTFEYPVGWP